MSHAIFREVLITLKLKSNRLKINTNPFATHRLFYLRANMLSRTTQGLAGMLLVTLFPIFIPYFSS